MSENETIRQGENLAPENDKTTSDSAPRSGEMKAAPEAAGRPTEETGIAAQGAGKRDEAAQKATAASAEAAGSAAGDGPQAEASEKGAGRGAKEHGDAQERGEGRNNGAGRGGRRGRNGRGSDENGGAQENRGAGNNEAGSDRADNKEHREPKAGREEQNGRQPKENKEAQNGRQSKEAGEAQNGRQPNENKEAQNGRQPKEAGEAQNGRQPKENKETQNGRQPKENKENKEALKGRENREPRQQQNGRQPGESRAQRGGRAAKGQEERRRPASAEGRGHASQTAPAQGGPFAAWVDEMRTFLRGRFSLEEDKAQSDEVVANISRGVEFRGMNLWVLIFATMIASLGLNVNSAAVIIGAMLISPIMGPIMGVGLALGINDFDLFKRSVRNLVLMFSVAIVTSTLYFLVSPLSANSSELLARTVPTTYDVLIALFGGLAGIVAQSCKDRNTTVIPGVAIATALIPPLCTAGFGLATGQWRFFLGAFYLFFINSVFIALATFAMVRFLRYEKRVFLDKRRERRVRRWMMTIALLTFIPSVVIGLRMVRVSLFESAVDRYVAQVFDFPQTRVVESECTYAWREQPSRIELLLLGEPLGDEVIDNARSQLRNFGLERAELVVRQASRTDEVDVGSLQRSYLELLEEKNRRIGEMNTLLERYCLPDVEVEEVSREAGMLIENIGRLSLARSILYDTEGTPCDTLIVCTVERRDSTASLDRATLEQWLRLRTKSPRVKLMVE